MPALIIETQLGLVFTIVCVMAVGYWVGKFVENILYSPKAEQSDTKNATNHTGEMSAVSDNTEKPNIK